MTPQEFIAKWQRAELSERSAYQQHFLDLCALLDQPTPASADPDGTWYTFERGVHKTLGGQGWADVWLRGHFGWEYKKKRKNLDGAYQQLLLYREDLENPPLLIVCDLDRFEVHTNFTGTAKRVHAFDLAGLADPENLDTLRKTFTNPEALRPGLTCDSITRQAAEEFGKLADGLRVRGVAAPDAAHFLMKLMFCMFAEDIELLPKLLFSRILTGSRNDPARLSQRLAALFGAMSGGGDFGADEVPWFNGGLFADADVIDLRPREIEAVIRVNDYDWSNVEPSIFGTLFERTLDPAKRSQIGAHYTSREDILTLLKPVVMAPLRQEWDTVRAACEKQWEKVRKESALQKRPMRRSSKASRDFERKLLDFVERLAHVRILDPACGSGNFLYVAINLLLDLEKEVIAYGAARGVSLLPHVRPTQLHGIEVNPYAQQLAQVVIWIGYLQWMKQNGFRAPSSPVLEPIETIRLQDAILDLTDPDNPKEPDWPEADYIVGNPPFLGNRLMAAHFDKEYLSALWSLYEAKLGGRPDLCCYWFERARQQIGSGRSSRAGLLATQAIRGGTNRNVLKRIKDSGDIFFAISDQKWILDGAMVHVSIIGFDNGTEMIRILDDQEVPEINPNLTSHADITVAKKLQGSLGIAYQGAIKRGSFDIPEPRAMEMLLGSHNPNRRPNSDVIVPYANGADITRSFRWQWVIDFGDKTPQEVASQYEAPFEHVASVVQKERRDANQRVARELWWLHWCTRPEMHAKLQRLDRFVVTPRLSKHRVFSWLRAPVYPDAQLIVITAQTNEMLGLVHCRVHEVWARAQGTQLRERESGFRYTPKSCFETFPFPTPTEAQREAIAEAARELDRLRNNWLNPPQWTREEVLEFPGSTDGPWARYVTDADARGIGTVRYPRVVPLSAECARELKTRTLTALYNARPTWLALAHRRLDAAVLSAYGWPEDLPDDALLARLLELNLAQAGA